jgi:tRNA nucleotidyltransferase (CCA-adding enzyme)
MKPEVLRLCETVRKAGGRAMLVGGTVRDRLLGLECEDFDVEVYGLEPEHLRKVLEHIGRVNTVGEHFSVYKLVFFSPRTEGQPGERFEIDVSVPRRESKSGRGHRGFVIEGDPAMTFEEATRRRDFTINAILYDPLSDETVDPYRGSEDLRNRVLRAVASDTFIEDSLRVLRAVQLAARFEMTIEPRTVDLCLTIDLSDLPRERILGEIQKWLMLAARPSIGLAAALELGVLDKLFPQIGALAGAGSAGKPSPADDAFEYTKRALDEAAKEARSLSNSERITVMLSTLCHDLGRPGGDPKQSATGNAAVELTRSVLSTLGLYGMGGYDVRSQVLSLVRERRRPSELYKRSAENIDGEFRRLAGRVDCDLLYRVAKAWAVAESSPSDVIGVDWFIDRARALGVEHGPPPPLLQGRHLIDAGYEPGPHMGELLREVYELQLDGRITTIDEALAAALKKGSPNSKVPEVFR